MAWHPAFRLIRPDDLVVLDIKISGLEPKLVTPPQPGGPKHTFQITGPAPEIWVQLGSQQIIEYAKPAGGVRADQADPLFVPRADLIFPVTAADLPIPATVEGLLAALRRLPLKVVSTDPEVKSPAAARRSGLDAHELVAATTQPRARRHFAARRAEAAARRALRRVAAVVASPAALTGGPTGPQPPTSQVPMPRRLAVRPPRGPVRMSHSPAQVTRGGRTELWHSWLAVRTTDPAAPPVEIEVPVELTALPNTAGTPAGSPRDENVIRNALFDDDCVDVADQIKPPYFNLDGTPTATGPARLGRLMLSALGGWLRLSGSWPSGVKELRVDTAQGRDQFQRKVVSGRLMPFGHKALLTSTTTRSFETGGTRVAGLETTTVMQILEPVVVTDPDGGVHAGWPFSSVELLHPEPLNGVEGVQDGFDVSTFEVGGLPFRFRCRGTDRSGQAIDFELPMVFADDGVTDTEAFAGWEAYTGIDLPPGHANRRDEYFTVQLAGQRLGVAVPPDEDSQRDEQPISPNATTVLARELQLALGDGNRPVMTQLRARVEALERFVPDMGEVDLQYAQPYLDHLLDGVNGEGQVFLQFAENTGTELAQPLVGLAGQATAGMAQVSLPIAALSRRFGAVAGELTERTPGQVTDTLEALASGDLDVRFLTAALGGVGNKLLGLVDLSDLIPLEPKPKLDEAQSIVTDALDGVTSQTLTWNMPLQLPLRHGFISLEATDGADPRLNIVQITEVDDMRKEMRTSATCTITGLALKVYATSAENDDTAIVTIPFREITFITRDGAKPEADVLLGQIEFGGILRFVAILAELIDQAGLSDPPALEVTSRGVHSSFSFDVPAVAVGMFALQNIAFSTALDLTFQPKEDKPALLLTVGFASRSNPFRLTVSMLGGGGYLEVATSSQGLARIEGSLSFGASLAVNFGVVAKGCVEAMGGVIFAYDAIKHSARLTAFLQVRGEANVLSMINVSVTLLLELTYDFFTEILSGHAEVVVEVSVWFFSQSVTVPYDWEAKTGNSDPTFAELMAPEDFAGERPWDTYCMAFAED